MSRRRRSVIRRPRAGSNLGWTAILTTGNTFAAATQEEQDIVIGSDWFGGAGDANATLLRIRGSFSGYLTAQTSTLAACLTWAVYVVDKDASPAALSSVNFMLDEDVLWHGTHQLVRPAADPQNSASHWHYDVDIKSKRKIDVGKEVRFAMVVDSVAGVYAFSARAVVRLP